jgi:negative regulator of sigma E activity
MNDGIRMQLSAFVDGELPQNEAELLLRRMSQDAELRREIAEYMAIGRLMRAEAGLAGADRLHERVAAEIDDRPVEAEALKAVVGASRAIRPLAGAAIAATVALIGIFALQQTTSLDELPAEMAPPVANQGVPEIDAQLERQRQFFVNHAETSSQHGANGMNSRVVSLRFSEELVDATEPDEPVEPADLDASEFDNEKTTTQP